MTASLLTVTVVALLLPETACSQEEIPDAVIEIFENKCAFSGCHAGGASGNGLDLSEETIYSSLVNQPSLDFENLQLVKPGEPLKSYLIMKLVGTSGIRGVQMPKHEQPIAKEELRIIASWIKSLPKNTKASTRKKRRSHSFSGLSAGSLQTTQTASKGSFSYRIAHRWKGRIDTGFGQFFGLDQGAHMLTEFSFPMSNDFTFTVGRSGTNATFEFYGKWRILKETVAPFSLAVLGGVDWATLKQINDLNAPGQFLSRSNNERFAWYGRIIFSRQMSNRIALLISPGILLNGNIATTSESPVFNLGLAGKFKLGRRLSLFIELAPILAGSNTALPVGGVARKNGQPTVYDAFTFGLEHSIGGHVFHVYATNSLGLTPSQVMSGGNLDFGNGELRLGFNIYRALRLH